MSDAIYYRSSESLRSTVFTQTDPLPIGAGTAFESSYVFVGNNPFVYVDPAGTCRGEPDSTWTTYDGKMATRPAPSPAVKQVAGPNWLQRNLFGPINDATDAVWKKLTTVSPDGRPAFPIVIPFPGPVPA